MFLKKLFNFKRDYQYYQEKGEKSFADERYSDARDAFGEALEMVGYGGDQSLILFLRGKFEESGNRLGELNLAEAEHAVRGGDFAKAEEHLSMVIELANDTSIRERAQKNLAEIGSRNPIGNRGGEMGPCTRCEEKSVEELHVHQVLDDDMESEDRLTLYFHSLPGDLPERYAAMGEKFARGCILNLDGDKEGALKLFEEISAGEDNDILDYEKAIIYYHKGETGRCEELLIRSMELNTLNPLCHIGLVHLYTDTGQTPKALPVLEGMIERDIVTEQALMMQGEIYAMLGDENNAIESYSRNLSSPRYAGEAAKRLIPLLEKHGRFEEASYLTKKFTKGCC
jgi:predicted negative regulator of RcsB-dependent stress response